MPVERRGWVIAFEIGSTGNGRNSIFNGRRQPSRGGTSRMTRECQVRICERLGVEFPGPTRPKRSQLAAIERKRPHRDQRLVQAWCWLRHLPQFDRRFAVGRIDQCEHLRLSSPSKNPPSNVLYLVWVD